MEAATITRPDPTRGERAREAQASTARTGAWQVADPAPLGLAAFALTTFVLSMFNAELVSKAGEPVVLGLALAYGGIAQLLAGMWEFRTGNTFGAVAFTSFGAFWLSFWAFDTFFAKEIANKADLGHAVGLYLIGWGIFTTYMFVASLRTTVAISVVFALLAATFFLLGIGNANADADIIKLGGWFGLATAVAAWYASFAAVMNSTFGRTILPVKPLK
jgi:uncharacterized protein